MSEFQFYEFKAIDKPLTNNQREEVSNWSSRTRASNTGATFTYHYGDFPQDELTVINEYFDAMFYMANWGSRRLTFKIPIQLVKLRDISQYSCEGLEIINKRKHVIIDMSFDPEDSYDDLFETDSILSSLISLRDDIISGDYRCLYLIWLKISTDDILNEYGDTVDENSLEPPVPRGLKSLNGALTTLIDVFDIDIDIVEAAAKSSISKSSNDDFDYTSRINALPQAEKNEWLIRLLNNEPALHLKLEKHLKGSTQANTDTSGRTIADIIAKSTEIEETKEEEERQKAQKAKVARIAQVESKASLLWKEVDTLIKEKNVKSYNEAIQVLLSLKELAEHKGELADFHFQIDQINNTYKALHGFKRRASDAGLFE